MIGSAAAQTGPLALPPSSDNQPASVPVTPQAQGLALPPDMMPPAPVAIPVTLGTAGTPTVVTGTTSIAPAAVTIEAATLKDIKPDSIGLMTSTEGGLGAGLWKGTSRAYVEKFMAMLSLPAPYGTLNNLANRFLLTTAGAPEGNPEKDSKQSLTALRVNKLIELGNAAEAWKLASLAAADQIDEATLRQAAEMAMVSPVASDVCSKLPALIKKYTNPEWQKLLLVCQLKTKDTKAAQISLDLLHTQSVHDDAFFTLVEKNIMVEGKQLPRQLTPLQPLTLALLRMVDLPVRAEIYARPAAALIPELLKVKAADENARLALAERAAVKGIISADDLIAIYQSETFTADNLSSATSSGERNGMLRALLYQASLQEKTAKGRVALGLKFLESLDAASIGGGVLSVMSTVLGDTPPSAEFNEVSASVARAYILAGKPSNAQTWLEQAHGASRGMPQVTKDLIIMWPLIVFGGLESEGNFDKNLNAWLDATLRPADQQDNDSKAQKTLTSSLMLLMDAMGFHINDDAWARVVDTAVPEKIATAPAFVIERLRSAATANRKGDAILNGLLATMGDTKNDPALLASLETIRALRTIGLPTDAGNLANDVALHVLNPAGKN